MANNELDNIIDKNQNADMSIKKRSEGPIEIYETMALPSFGGQPAYNGETNNPVTLPSFGGQPAYNGETNNPVTLPSFGGQPAYNGEMNNPVTLPSFGGQPAYNGETNNPVTLPSFGGKPAYNGGMDVNFIPICDGYCRIAYVRFLNAVPNSEPVDIYLNRKLVAEKVSYKEFTPYLRAVPGAYRLDVYRAGTRNNPLYQTNIRINSKTYYTLAISGSVGAIGLSIITDVAHAQNDNRANMRFINLSISGPAMDVYVGNILVVMGLVFDDVSNYLQLIPNTYTIRVKASDTDVVIAEEPNVNLNSGGFFGAYIVGGNEYKAGYQILVEPEGTGRQLF